MQVKPICTQRINNDVQKDRVSCTEKEAFRETPLARPYMLYLT